MTLSKFDSNHPPFEAKVDCRLHLIEVPINKAAFNNEWLEVCLENWIGNKTLLNFSAPSGDSNDFLNLLIEL